MPTVDVQDRLLLAISAYLVDRSDATFQREFAPLLDCPACTAQMIVYLAGGWVQLTREEWAVKGLTAEQVFVHTAKTAAEMSSRELAAFNAYRVYSALMNGDVATGWALAIAATEAGEQPGADLVVAVAMEFVAAFDRVQELAS